MAEHLDLSEETPSNKADVHVLRESTGLSFNLQLGPAKMEVTRDEDEPNSPSAIGVTMLLLAAGGSVPSGLFAMAGRAAHVSPTLIATGALALFLTVFGTGIALILRGGAEASRDTAEPPPEPTPGTPPNRLDGVPRMRNRRTHRSPPPRSRR